ncbi:MAG: hypothetical protein KFF73_19140 [Cyclobacteriaceae bacterium]|nr:hypothetical protein [Cyclobacteriaceae bacterium]
MISFFSVLQEDEQKVMFRIPVLISIMIAGADDKFEKREISQAVSLAKNRLSNSREILNDYYKIAGDNFEEKLSDEIDSLPSKAAKRNPVIIAELEKLNNILPKLDKTFAIQFYESMKDFAKQIATSSGGFFGYLTIHPHEQKLLDLKMIRDPAKR